MTLLSATLRRARARTFLNAVEEDDDSDDDAGAGDSDGDDAGTEGATNATNATSGTNADDADDADDGSDQRAAGGDWIETKSAPEQRAAAGALASKADKALPRPSGRV